jgi:hypothetical protein
MHLFMASHRDHFDNWLLERRAEVTKTGEPIPDQEWQVELVRAICAVADELAALRRETALAARPPAPRPAEPAAV